MKKQNIMPIAVLTAICVIVAALLGGVNELTKDRIRDNALKKEQASLIEVLPESSLFSEIEFTEEMGLPKTVKSAYAETSGKGYVLIMATRSQYSTEDMTISVGIYPDGSVAGVKLTNYKESKDFGKTTYPEKYVGTTADTYDDVEVTSGVTISSNAFKAAIGDAISAAAILSSSSTASTAPQRAATLLSSTIEKGLPESDDALSSLVSILISSDDFSETEIPAGAPETLKKLFAVDGNGYVAYIVVPGQYVPVATAAIIHVDKNGDIKNINLLDWVVGHDVGAGDFANGFVGKDVWHMNEVELVSGATGTSSDFYNEVNKTLEVLTDLLGTREQSFNDLVSETANSKSVVKAEIPAESPETLKGLYAVENNGGYVAHLVVSGDYVDVATEALVYIDSNGTVQKVNLLKWIVGHDVSAGDFADRFVGKSIWTVNEVELVSGATGTSQDLYDEIKSSLSVITDLLGKREEALLSMIAKMIPNSKKIEKIELPKDAPSTLVGLYKDSSGRGSVAHLIVPGAYAPVATEAFVSYNQWGEITEVKLIEWIVGHGIGPGDFADRFIGANKDTVEEVLLVTGCTGTSGDLKTAIADAFPYVPVSFPIWRIVGIAILTLSIAAFIAASVISKKRRTVK